MLFATIAVRAGCTQAPTLGWHLYRHGCPASGIALRRRNQANLVMEEVGLRSKCLVVVATSLALSWGVPAASQGPPADQVSRGADGPELEGISEAIQVFRQVTASAGLRPGQRSAEQRTRLAGSRASSWHGRLFEYFRNDILDAVPHEVVQRGGDRNLRRRNQFGFTVNGPVVIPGIYDGRGSSFFTFSYEGTRERVGRSYLMTLPTAQQRFADISDLVNRGRPAADDLRSCLDPPQSAARSGPPCESIESPIRARPLPAESYPRISR